VRFLEAVPAALAASVILAACSGSPIVAQVNGETITAEQVDALTAESPDDAAVAGAPFRASLSLLIINAAMRTAAEEQFGANGLDDPDALAARIADPPTEREITVFDAIASDPNLTEAWALGAAENFVIRDLVVGVMATGDEADDGALDAVFFDWRAEVVEAADIQVRSQVGEWGDLSTGVLPPPP
jgi:hypothetical protein